MVSGPEDLTRLNFFGQVRRRPYTVGPYPCYLKAALLVPMFSLFRGPEGRFSDNPNRGTGQTRFVGSFAPGAHRSASVPCLLGNQPGTAYPHRHGLFKHAF